jgi:hypothetical protein
MGADGRRPTGYVRFSRRCQNIDDSWLIIWCLVLSEYSEAKPSAVESSDAWRELALAIQSEQFLPTPFLLSDWYQDTGSGGFPPNFVDEHPLMDKWERSPDEGASGSWFPVENCVHWPC